ncbi:hypothetical protein CEXT_728351 [Caerostris extrusa]|uniref:Transposase n=1 Tax=Caerostris extrusa TaxID=172846 RepID=A0AAV4NX01_CAEEX|nr:hypothetical protein CEXT_728351 [Caerostris extrusa]
MLGIYRKNVKSTRGAKSAYFVIAYVSGILWYHFTNTELIDNHLMYAAAKICQHKWVNCTEIVQGIDTQLANVGIHISPALRKWIFQH